MEIRNYPNILSLIEDEFPNYRKTVRKNFSLTSIALLQSKTCALPDIALQMAKINGQSHNTNLVRLSRFLKSSQFQIGDEEWRMFIGFIFQLIKENNLVSKGDCIPINVDYTSSTDKFLILTASIPFHRRGIPLYFSMRLYPKNKNKTNLVKMQTAFIKELAHLLPKTYTYVLIADRGFGNRNFAELCLKNNLHYILRVAKTYILKVNGEKKKVGDIKSNTDYQLVSLTEGDWKTRLVTSMNKDNAKDDWYIATSLSQEQYDGIINLYTNRFGIEKMFQDEKGSGFEIESSKITKYMRFKRLFFCILFAQVLLMFVGNYVVDNLSDIKKKFRLHIGLISAFLLSPEELVKTFTKK